MSNEFVTKEQFEKLEKNVKLLMLINGIVCGHLDKKDKIIETFDFISELRGWLWESYFMGKQNDVKEYDNVLKLLRNFMHEWAKEFNLKYVED